jgi:Zn-dependent protease
MNIFDMDIYLLLYLIFAAAPMGIVLHEFGHALAAKSVNADNIIISVGKGKRLKIFYFSSMQLVIHTTFFLGGLAESQRLKPYKPGEVVWIAILGPITNGIIAFLFYMLDEIIANNYLQLFYWFNVWIAVVNIIPIKVKDKYTDGYMIMQVILGKKY